MVRLSDILKHKIQNIPSPQEEKPKAEIGPAKEKLKELEVAKAMKELQPDMERSRAFYSRAKEISNLLFKRISQDKPFEVLPIKELVKDVVNYSVMGDKTLFTLFYDDYPATEYLNNHMINTLIMAVEVGLGLGYNKSQLEELGLAAFLHDIGMIKINDITFLSRKFTDEEFKRLKEHPLYGANILSQLKDFPEAVVRAVQEEHERFNGQGYPKGIKNGDINEYARIIACVDVYEALTHKRVYRNKYPPHEAIKDMLASGSSLFDSGIFKILINRVGIYPIGTWIELNTKEIGKVIALNSDEFPLRPAVNILFDNTGARLEDSRVMDLAKYSNLFIKRPLSDEEVLGMIKEG